MKVTNVKVIDKETASKLFNRSANDRGIKMNNGENIKTDDTMNNTRDTEGNVIRPSNSQDLPQFLPASYLSGKGSGIPSTLSVPPLPPRAASNQLQTSRRFMNYNSNRMFNSYSCYGMGNSPFNSYGNGYGFPGLSNDSMNNYFVQMAEESARPAFQSIETFVEAANSISMMLESTYHAVHSSYCAILGVVDHFSRMKQQLISVLSIFTLLRGLRWLCLKLLYLLKIRKIDPSTEAAWSSATRAVAANIETAAVDGAKPSSWPVFVFIGLVLGAPWLILQLLSKSVGQKPDPTSWMTDGTGREAVAMFDFEAGSPQEISFRAGQRIIVAPISVKSNVKGWVWATTNGKTRGLVPGNRIAQRRKKPATEES